MKGLWLENQCLSYRDQLPLPALGRDEVLVKLHLAGICSTDLEMVKGYYKFTNIPGHEFVGEVVQSPANPGLLNQRVVGEISIYCGVCPTCLAGNTSHCENRRTLGIQNYPGVFAEYLRLPARNLHLVPDSVSDEKAVFTELLAAALEIQQQIHISPGMRVLVVGAGRLGLLIAMTLGLKGCELQVVARRHKPIEILSNLGIRCISPDQVERGRSDLVVEVTGSPQGFALSRTAVRPRGILVLKSTFAGDLTLNMSSVVVDEIQLIGSRCGPFKPAIKLMENDLIDPTILIDSIYPLEKGLQAFDRASSPGVLKVLLKP